jgi:hypothetical protein
MFESGFEFGLGLIAAAACAYFIIIPVIKKAWALMLKMIASSYFAWTCAGVVSVATLFLIFYEHAFHRGNDVADAIMIVGLIAATFLCAWRIDVLEKNEREQMNSQIAQIEAFKRDPKNRFFENVRQDMAKLFQTGKADTLQEAYDAACWLNPDIRAILIEEAEHGTAARGEPS